MVTWKDIAIDSKAGILYNPRLLNRASSTVTMPQLTFQVFFNRVCDDSYTAESLDKHLKIMEINSGFVTICTST